MTEVTAFTEGIIKMGAGKYTHNNLWFIKMFKTILLCFFLLYNNVLLVKKIIAYIKALPNNM